MRADEAVAIVRALESARVSFWVTGGWGVDALAHAVTREHRDLDLAVASEGFNAARQTLLEMGFVPETDWLPVRLEVAGGPGGWVDLHPVVFDEHGDGEQSGPDGQSFAYPGQDLTTGEINGCAVPCISARLQRSFHSGYEPRPQDLHDLRVLESLA